MTNLLADTGRQQVCAVGLFMPSNARELATEPHEAAQRQGASMPHSNHFPMTLMLEHIVKLEPSKVIDIGVGFGKWGYLTREALDFCRGRLERPDWKVVIHGVEVFPYRSPIHDWVYDRILREDILAVADDIKGYDLVIMGDVIEHLEKRDGLALLRNLLAQNRNVLLSTPLQYFTQEIADNEHEHHLSHWKLRDFEDFTYDYDVAGGAAIVVLLAGQGASSPSSKDKRVSRAVYRVPGLKGRGAAARIIKGILS